MPIDRADAIARFKIMGNRSLENLRIVVPLVGWPGPNGIPRVHIRSPLDTFAFSICLQRLTAHLDPMWPRKDARERGANNFCGASVATDADIALCSRNPCFSRYAYDTVPYLQMDMF
jgi:hypothetical protein